jgi:hypothetical protein
MPTTSEGGGTTVTIPQPLVISTESSPVSVSNISLYPNKYMFVVQTIKDMLCYQNVEGTTNMKELIKRMIKNCQLFWNILPEDYRRNILSNGADISDF